MHARLRTTLLLLLAHWPLCAAETPGWWNPRWRLRTTVRRPTPCRSASPRPVEVAVDFPLLLRRAGMKGELDPASIRVIERGAGRAVPFARRAEHDARRRCTQAYLTWLARPTVGELGVYDIYFDTKDRGIEPPRHKASDLPPPNLLSNPGFEAGLAGRPGGWGITPAVAARLGRFAHTTGRRSLRLAFDEKTPAKTPRDVVVSQKVDVRRFAGQEMVFECDLLAERAAYGCPVAIELQQFRADGSRIPELAVQSRWLTIELAEGHLVQFCQRGRFSPEAAAVSVRFRLRCSVRDSDTRRPVTGPESFFTVWLDRVVLRPGERWPWPAATGGGFVEGALKHAPLNKGFHFTGLRRLAFNGASEGTLQTGRYNPSPESVHWGLRAGTLEFWCRPSWNGDDGVEHVFFESLAYGHRRQCRLRKRDASGGNQLELSIADAGCTTRTVRGPAPLRAGQWHHVAATWDFTKAHLQLFVDGKRIAQLGPGKKPWPSSMAAVGGPKKTPGIGIMDKDTRSMPMQAFIGGDRHCRSDGSAEAVLDELRISDVPRYTESFTPTREEFALDSHTRALFHLEDERHGVHHGDDRFVRGHLACELPPREDKVALDVLKGGKVDRRIVPVKPHAAPKLFEENRIERRLVVHRPHQKLPDPRFVEYREREATRTVTGKDDGFTITVGGDYEPLMRSITFEHAKGAPTRTTLLPRWVANDNVVPFSHQSLAATLAPKATSDPDRALAVWRYLLATTNYYDAHFCETLPNGRHRSRVAYTVTKALNLYAFDQCGPLNHVARKLFLAAGISSNDASGTHHQFQQAFYHGGWRLFDLSARKFWLLRDNATVAGRDGFEDDLYLKLRQGDGIGSGIRGRRSRARFGAAVRPHSMDFPLRPGERVSFGWHNEGRWFELTGKRKPIPLAKIPPYFGNGAIVYEPTPEGEAAALDNLLVAMPGTYPSSLPDPVLRAVDPARPAALVYRIQCPYIFSDARVRGSYAAAKAGAVGLSLSFDRGKKWTQVWHSPNKEGTMAVDLLEHVAARYAYWLKLELAPGRPASITDLEVRTTFVASPLALPGKLRRGANRIRFVGGPPTVPVTTTCRWAERHRTDLGLSLSAISYYLNGDEARRNVFVVPPRGRAPVRLTLWGRRLRGEATVDGAIFDGRAKPETRRVEIVDPAKPVTATCVVSPKGLEEGAIEPFTVSLREGKRERRVDAQLLVAAAPLVREAERADKAAGGVAASDNPEVSGGREMIFRGDGTLTFDFTAPQAAVCALWLRARWRPDHSTRMTLTLDRAKPRDLRAAAMIGFTDWTDPRRAHTKMFAHYGEQFAHWSWYRIPDVKLTKGKHRLTLAAAKGASFDALLLLPQTPTMDRAAMNLLMNWNFAPWHNVQ